MSDVDSNSEIDRSDDPLAFLVEELTKRLLAGEVVDIESLAQRQPETIARLKEFVPIIRMMVVAGRSGLSRKDLLPHDTFDLESRLIGDEFRILHVIGRGGMGIVYAAEQLSLSRIVALKVLPVIRAADAKSRARFQIEANAASKLTHPNIVQVYSVGTDREVHYYAMQFIDGPSLALVIRWLREEQDIDFDAKSDLASRIARNLIGQFDAEEGRLPGDDLTRGVERSAWRLMSEPTPDKIPNRPIAANPNLGLPYFRSVAYLGSQAAEALDHAHELGVVHRDIKPSNLLIDRHEKLWITDFGLAQIQGHGDLTGSDELIGTTRYMSPEQAEAKHYVLDHRTDIYSLGVTLYELLTLEQAFPGSNQSDILRRIIHEDPVRPSILAPKLPRDLETIVLKAISKNPVDRYDTAKEMADDLRRFLAGRPVNARRISRFELMVRAFRRHPLVTSLFATIVVLTGLWGVYAYS